MRVLFFFGADFFTLSPGPSHPARPNDHRIPGPSISPGRSGEPMICRRTTLLERPAGQNRPVRSLQQTLVRRVRSSLPSLSLVLALSTLGALSTLAQPSSAQSWDPFPQLVSGRRLALGSGVDPSPFRTTERCLAKPYASGASFYAAVVRVSDPSGSRSPQYSNAVPYVDALYDAWRSPSLDASTHILIAVSLDNRGIAIHPGLRWADLGLEGDAIRRVIDGSKFGDWARSGEMGKALCVLAEAVDQDLEDLQQAGRRRIDDLGRQLQGVAEQRSLLQGRAAKWERTYPELGARWTQELDRMEGAVSDGRRAVQRRRLADARSALSRAQAGLERLAGAMDAVEATHEALPQLDREIERRGLTLAAAEGSSTPAFARARRQWSECRTMRASLETSLLEGQPADAAALRGCLDAFDGYLDAARDAHHLRYVVLPLLLVGGLMLAALGALLLQLLRVRAARRAADTLLDAWQRRLDQVADRLLEIESELPLYFTPDHVRWTGESRELDQRCATAVNHVYVLFSEANLLLDRARRVAAGLRYSSLRNLDRTNRVLHDSRILEAADTDAPGLKLRLPGAVPQLEPCTGAELLDRLEARCAALTGDIRQVIALEERFYELVQESDTVSADAAEAGKARAELAAPIESLERRLAPLLDRRRSAMDLSSDPIRANAALEAVVADLKALHADIQLGNGTLRTLRGDCTERREKLWDRVRSMRDDGFELLEPGLSADLRLERSLRQATEIEDTVADGREKEAAALLDRLQFGLLELNQQLTTVETTRANLPDRLQKLEAQAAELRARIPGGQEILSSLHSDHAPETFVAESDNLAELDELLTDFTAWCRDIRQDYDTQHYLAAAEDLATGVELVTRGKALLDAVETIQQDLEDTRQRARDLGRELDGRLAELRRRAEQRGVAAETRRNGEQTADRAATLLESLSTARPHWPHLEQNLASASSFVDSLLRQMGDEISHLQEAEGLAQEWTARLANLQQQVLRETRDREFVAEGVAAAGEALAAWRTELGGEAAHREGGTALLRRGKQAEAKIQWAEGLWRSEMDLVRAAEAKLAGARDMLRREQRRHFGYGVVASCEDAEATLWGIEALRNRRDWQGVLDASRRATEQIQNELERCRGLARRREEEERRALEARRRAEERARRQAAAAAAEVAARAAAAAWSSSRTSSSGFGRRSSGFSSSSGSSRSSGSSFGGGSRSGGSSW